MTPSADTGLSLTFEANGATHAPPADGYFEASGRYRIKATTRPHCFELAQTRDRRHGVCIPRLRATQAGIREIRGIWND